MSTHGFGRLTGVVRELVTEELGLLASSDTGEELMDGTLVLHPREKGMLSKEIPLRSLFHKIVLIRDRLRMVEQVINSSKGLNDVEKVRVQAQVTRVQEALVALAAFLQR